MKIYKRKFNEDIDDVKKKICDFFRDNPTPSDSEIHKFAESIKVDVHLLETIIYRILGSFLGAGKSVTGKKMEYDPEQVKLGVPIELEHCNDKYLALKIVHDHLQEFPNYYTYLIQMEDFLKEKIKKETK